MDSESSDFLLQHGDGAHLSWEAPDYPRGNILEYSVYLAVTRNAPATSVSLRRLLLITYCLL